MTNDSAVVLILDDSATVRMDLAEAFREAGFRCIPCATGQDARDALGALAVALVVLDVVLPDADGIEFLKELREGTLAIPVLILSNESRAILMAELERKNQQLREASRVRGDFLASLSHELRTPLNAIMGFAELMHEGRMGPVSPEHRECLEDILTSSRHLLQLINDVLDLAKVEAGRVEFQPEPVVLARVVEELRDIVRSLSLKKRIDIAVDVAPDLATVVLDPGKLRQVLYNFLSNALKFTGEGGRVTIRARAEDALHLRLEVEDTGIGIRAEDLPRLFGEFPQLDAGAAESERGTGLGLALTKRLVEAQGGRVGATSTVGKGSLFFAVLPRDARKRESASQTSS